MSALIAFGVAMFIMIVRALILFSAAFVSQAPGVALFGAFMLSGGAAWLCDGLFAMHLYTRDPSLWHELGRPEVSQSWGPQRFRQLYFTFLPASRYPRGLWVQHHLVCCVSTLNRL